MSVFKEGDTVNFTKASGALDGCVKTYSSRVDATQIETGRLLQGLAASRMTNQPQRRPKNNVDPDASDEEGEGEQGEDEEGPKVKKRKNKISEGTLASKFEDLQLKKGLDLEFSVDPLFKKATADFDEGGATGLLLNHLSIDKNGRIIFDSIDAYDEDKRKAEVEAMKVEDEDDADGPEGPADVAKKLALLKNQFFPDLSKLEGQDVCPTLKTFEIIAKEGKMEIPFLKDDATGAAPGDDLGDLDAIGAIDDDGAGADDGFGFEGGVGYGDMDDINEEFGGGGDLWANSQSINEITAGLGHNRVLGLAGAATADDEVEQYGGGGVSAGQFDFLKHFDESANQNWAGPEHWKIRKIKNLDAPVAPGLRKIKVPFSIDFMEPGADAPEEMLARPKIISSINLPRKDWVSKSKNKLPDDKHFSAKQLMQLFLKPNLSLLSSVERGVLGDPNTIRTVDLDAEYWSTRAIEGAEIQASSTPGPRNGEYNANFFMDDQLNLPADMPDDDEDDAFADARENFLPDDAVAADVIDVNGVSDPAIATQSSQIPVESQWLDFGAQLVPQARRLRPEYVRFARVAKKVDVRKLKQNIWTGLGLESPAPLSAPPRTPGGDTPSIHESAPPAPPPMSSSPDSLEPRKFTKVIQDLRAVYPQKTMADISTSYCFICVLHLANEKGLVIEEEGSNLQELIIRNDPTARGPDPFD